MGLTYVSATVVAKDGMEQELEKALAGVVVEVRKEKGCIRYDLHRSDYGNVFLFYTGLGKPGSSGGTLQGPAYGGPA